MSRSHSLRRLVAQTGLRTTILRCRRPPQANEFAVVSISLKPYNHVANEVDNVHSYIKWWAEVLSHRHSSYTEQPSSKFLKDNKSHNKIKFQTHYIKYQKSR